MITVRKLSTLPERSIVRKAAYLFRDFSRRVSIGDPVDLCYLEQLCRLPGLHGAVSERSSEMLTTAAESLESADQRSLVICLDDLYYQLLGEIGASPADWDFVDSRSGQLDRSQRIVFPVRVYLDRVRSPFNVGSIFRTADSFGVSRIVLGEGTASPEHTRAKRTARGCEHTVDWNYAESENLGRSLSDPVFALELGGIPIDEFSFPTRGTVIIGSEELGVSPDMIQIARKSLGCVSIPLAGTKGSLNVSVAFGILMQYWFASLSRTISSS